MGVQKYPADIREQCIKLRNDGLTFVEIAARLDIPYWKSVARIFYTNGETSGRLMSDEEKQTIIDLYVNGYSVQSIAEQTRRSVGAIRKHLTDKGFISVCDKSTRESKYAEMREYKAQGHTIAETNQHFGVTNAAEICKGIAPQKADYAKASKTLKEYNERERNNRIERLKEKLDDAFEYVGGYDGSDGYVTIRCKQCGTEFERSAQAIRKRQVKNCPCCRQRDAERREREKEERRIMREAQEEIRRHERERKELERVESIRQVDCVVCGKRFETRKPNKLCCSQECSRKYANRYHDKRIAKEKRVDFGINALSLFKRDNGVCWICGGKCDLNDYTTRNGAFIAGDWYPSVDHIIAICDGGEDSWENVKLAHRICNTRRYFAEKTAP